MSKQVGTRKRRKPSRLWQRAEYDPTSTIVYAKDLPKAAGPHYQTARRMRARDPESFPAPLRLTPGRIGWLRSDLDRWLATRRRAS
jgi:hypothetical protein